MTRLPFSRPAPRRALIESPHGIGQRWLQHGMAALAVSVLGLGVAGSVALTGAASPSTARPAATPSVVRTVEPGVALPDAFDTDQAERPTRSDQRPALTPVGSAAAATAVTRAVKDRADALESAAISADKQADKLAKKAAEKKRKAKRAAEAAAKRGCVPVQGGYSVAARFGDVGSWARYHTGFDFSAPFGTRLRAPASGTVMVAGAGPASWAGNYVVIRTNDGNQVLLAHMSTVSVKAGQQVSACDTVGAVGVTGRSFGPHLHFEVYPPGTEPGDDVYRAVDPLGWLTKMGIKP